MIHSLTDILKRERIVAIGHGLELGAYLRRRYPDLEIACSENALDAIVDLAEREARAVIVYADGSDPQLGDALAGLRDAAGERTRILLCCPPVAEPQARDALALGADDYVLWPLDGGTLDSALGYVAPDTPGEAPAEEGVVGLDELQHLAELVAKLDQHDSYTVLGKLADLLRRAMHADGLTLVVDGSAVTSGATVVHPVLTETLERDRRRVGQITVGSRDRAYSAGDVVKLKHYAALSSNLLALAARQKIWREEALTDELSGLHNRRYLLRFLADLLPRARNERSRVTVLLFDIDDFKSYNDRYGHAAGDTIIRRIGQLFKSHCREHDLVTRYGGDEFCVVFWDADQPRVAGSQHPTDAFSVLRRFRAALQTYQCAPAAEEHGPLTISGGLASYPWDASTVDELLDRADQALLQAKQAGKNQVFVFGGDGTDASAAPTDPPA